MISIYQLTDVGCSEILKIDNLEIKENAVTCIIGKSGGGKTTFLKLLKNMINYDQGSIKFKGKEISEYDPVKLRRHSGNDDRTNAGRSKSLNRD